MLEPMDITPPPTSNPNPKSPEPETETPTPIQPSKPLPFTNGVLKRRHHNHHYHHHHHHQPPIVITYKECLKNHAANIGGHALDGCGEFMPSPNATPTDPTSLKCSVCGCHRNFHRREPEDIPPPPSTATIEFQPHHRHHPPPPHRSPSSASPPPISSSYYPSAPHMLLALSGGVSGAPTNGNGSSHLPTNLNLSGSEAGQNSRKRFRTKFSQIQKERMLEFAERVGWKMQKRDDELVHEFCNEIGVDRGVLKVWMHNNKNTKRNNTGNIGGGGGGGNGCSGGGALSNGQNLNELYDRDGVGHVSTNGSSSSS